MLVIKRACFMLTGRWVLPCASCDDSNSCYWREAVWTPRTCRYSVLSRDDARKCLANKKVYVRAVILNVNVQHVGKLTFKLTSRLLPRLLESPFRFFFHAIFFGFVLLLMVVGNVRSFWKAPLFSFYLFNFCFFVDSFCWGFHKPRYYVLPYGEGTEFIQALVSVC